MLDLLMSDEEYAEEIQNLLDFAEYHQLPFKGTHASLLDIVATLLLSLAGNEETSDEDVASFMTLTKLVFNIGYRANITNRKAFILH